jgi:hypothetical protein
VICQMYKKKYITIAASLVWIFVLLLCLDNSSYASILIITEPTFAQVKGGLSASSVNPNSTIGERSGNTIADLATGGTSAASVTDGLAMTMSSSSSGKTGNMTNITSNEGGLSASSSVNKVEE